MSRKYLLVGILVVAIPGIGCTMSARGQDESAGAVADAAKRDFFESKIRPVLIKHCYECHSADSEILQGGLRVDTRETIRRGGDSGPAVVPGNTSDSLILEALRYESFEMPPDGKLDDHIITDFETWISRGAIDPREDKDAEALGSVTNAGNHWAFRPRDAVGPPPVNAADWPITPIDRFILAELESRDMQPAPDASDRDLVRRIYFDLTGLPPAPPEVEAFVKDVRPDKITHLVDRLLASPHYGERWGRHWLDVARYSDSSGGGRVLIFHDAWWFRDYVIQSFNDDKPFDQFVLEQVAGDLLPHDNHQQRAEQLTATGFLMLGPHNYELQDKELLQMEIVDEQIDVVGRAFLGLTLGCARCHDHKFDPVSTEEYYALAGIFRSTHSVEHANVSRFVESELPLEPDQQRRFNEYRSQLDELNQQITKLTTEIKLVNSRVAEQVLTAGHREGQVLDDEQAELEGKWSTSDSVTPYVGKGYRYSNDPTASATFEFTVDEAGEYEIRVSYTPHANRSKQTAVAVQGVEQPRQSTLNQTVRPATDGLFQSLGRFACRAEQSLRVVFQPTGNGYTVVDAVQLVRIDQSVEKLAEDRSDAQASLDRLAILTAELESLNQQLAQHKKSAPASPPKVMSVRDAKETGDYFVCIRGDAHRLGEQPVARRALEAVGLPTDLSIESDASGRMELAQWIADPENPLTARVYVNRVWLHLMGRGLVHTPDNFGLMGQSPTHAALLDYLANEFVQHGWSTKRLIREIVTSRCYRQSSEGQSSNLMLDPQNRFYSRTNRRRLDVEVIRDAILSFSGELDLTRGGPVVPNDLKSEFGFQYRSKRRSVYLPVFRNTLFDMFDVFDFPNPNLVSGKRNESTLPAQALYLMNSPFVIEQSRLAAERLLAIENLDDDARIDLAFQMALGRPPSDDEHQTVSHFLESPHTGSGELEQWADICQTLISSLDFRYVK